MWEREVGPEAAVERKAAEVSHLLIYQSPACFTDTLTIIDMLLR